MKELLARLDAIGIQGINLLELCFPLHNAPEFARRAEGDVVRELALFKTTPATFDLGADV